MSKKERLENQIGQLLDLVRGLDLEERPEGVVVSQPATTSTLSPAAAVFEPAGTSKQGDQSSKSAVSEEEWEEDWESIPDLDTSVSTGTPPTYSQVVGGPQAVLVTPLSAVSRSVSVGSVSTGVMANPGVGGAIPAAPAPLPFSTAAQFDAWWQASPNDQARLACENAAMSRGNSDVKLAALLKRDVRHAQVNIQLQGQVTAAQAAAVAAQNAAVAVSSVKAAAPPRFENKEKDGNIRQWLSIVEEYLTATPAADYLRMAGSYLQGKPRTYWVTQYAAYKAANNDAEPGDPRKFFRDTMMTGYGIVDPLQSYWDTYNKLAQGQMSIHDYNIAFSQALTDLANEVTDEQVKIEKYRSGLQSELREVCRTNPQGTRWTTLDALVRYATLKWPGVEAVLKAKKEKQPASKVGNKRKAAAGRSPGRSSKARLGALSEEQLAYNMEHRLCHKCSEPGHIARDCPGTESKDKSGNKGKGNKGNKKKDFQKN